MMEVIKQIKWSQEDRHYLNQLDKWISLCERIEATVEEEKAAARLARGSGMWMDENQLIESLRVWHKIHSVMIEQNADAVKLEANLPETAEGGIIARPKQAMICLQEAAVEAMKDIDEVTKLVVLALELLRG